MNSQHDRQTGTGWCLEHSYQQLPAIFHSTCHPEPVSHPQWVLLNQSLALALGLDAEALLQTAEVLSGNALPPGSTPVAMAYAGHQFGHFNLLGDGRAHLLGEQRTPAGTLVDIHLKGSGVTPYSRRGDGRAALAPMLREYIISEAMHALGIPTTRSLAVIASGDPVIRERRLPGAILTRVASSHIRIGTFQYAAHVGGADAVKAIADYTIQRHYPELTEQAEPYLALLEAVMERQADLLARWMQVGFIHGVMNTDNMTLSGETIDYGPCAFMNHYDPQTVFSSIDHGGRYAYGNQPQIAWWNLARLAEVLAPLTDRQGEASGFERTAQLLHTFPERYQNVWLQKMRGKLGLCHEETGDRALAEDFLSLLQEGQADFTHSFRTLSALLPSMSPTAVPPAWQAWIMRWHQRLQREAGDEAAVRQRMNQHNPAVIPRNHLVEHALASAADHGDLQPLQSLMAVLATPYADCERPQAYIDPPAPNPGYRTFCGT